MLSQRLVAVTGLLDKIFPPGSEIEMTPLTIVENSAANLAKVRWIKHDIWNELAADLRKKFKAAMNKGFALRREGESGIIFLTEKEIIKEKGYTYTHKLKIMGQGASHYRLYGRVNERGDLIFDLLKNE